MNDTMMTMALHSDCAVAGQGEPRRIATVYLWQNQMVMVFDQYGTQLDMYQGMVSEVIQRLLRDAPEDTRWHIGQWDGWVQRVERSWFVALLPLATTSS